MLDIHKILCLICLINVARLHDCLHWPIWKELFMPNVTQTANMSKKIVYPAANKNRSPILGVLKQWIQPNATGRFLEIGSGTGQHLSFFASHFPNVTFQPSEYDRSMFESIQAYAEEVKTKNMLPPVEIDVCNPPDTWPVQGKFDYVLSVNMFHITAFKCTILFFKHCAEILQEGGLAFTYGPYAICGHLEPQSNVNFDENLKSRNPEWGLRDVKDVQLIAKSHKIRLQYMHGKLTQNKTLVWKKDSTYWPGDNDTSLEDLYIRGIRDVKDVQMVAKAAKISLPKISDMPANNKIIVWKKDSSFYPPDDETSIAELCDRDYDLRAIHDCNKESTKS